MNRSLAFAVPVALALSFGVTGCTIYTYSDTPNSKKGGKARPKPATTTTTTPTGRIPKRPSTGQATPGNVPTVTSKTVFGGGAVGAFHGFAYVIPDTTTRMPAFDELIPFAQFYTDQFDVAPQPFSGGFPGALLQDEWFGIRYAGNVLVPVKTTWSLKLTSDDGAILYLDGKKIIDNDGIHAAKSTVVQVDLDAGTHTLQLDYFQEKKGDVALQLSTVVGTRDVMVIGSR